MILKKFIFRNLVSKICILIYNFIIFTQLKKKKKPCLLYKFKIINIYIYTFFLYLKIFSINNTLIERDENTQSLVL